MRRWVAIVAVLAAARAGGQEPAPAADPRLYAPPQADDSPTPFACTAESLAAGTRCVFESSAPAAADPARQALDNAAAAARLAEPLCRRASRHPQEPIPDPDVLAACTRAFTTSANACGTVDARALLDAQGRFAGEARLCYAALAEVLSRAQTAARLSAACCRCLAGEGCAASAERCNADALTRLLGGAAARCAGDRCPDACRSYLPSSPEPAAPAAAAAPPPGAAGPRAPDDGGGR